MPHSRAFCTLTIFKIRFRLTQRFLKAPFKSSFYKTNKGLVELDPSSLPEALTQGNGILIDEMASYNYKANYEQQLLINELVKKIGELTGQIEELKRSIDN